MAEETGVAFYIRKWMLANQTEQMTTDLLALLAAERKAGAEEMRAQAAEVAFAEERLWLAKAHECSGDRSVDAQTRASEAGAIAWRIRGLGDE